MGLLEIFLTGVGLAMDAFAVSICKGLEQKKLNVINMLIIALFFGFFQFAMPVIAYFCCRGFSGYIESYDHWIAFGLLVFIGLKMIIECVVEYIKEKRKLDTNQPINNNMLNISSVPTDNKTNKNTSDNKNLNVNNKFSKKDVTNTLEVNNKTSQSKITENFKTNNKEQIVLQQGSNTKLENNNSEINISSNSQKLNLKELFVLAIATSIDALVVGITIALTNTNIFLASGIIGIVTFVICCVGVLIGTFFGSKFKTTAEIFGGVILILIGLKILLEHLGVLMF